VTVPRPAVNALVKAGERLIGPVLTEGYATRQTQSAFSAL